MINDKQCFAYPRSSHYVGGLVSITGLYIGTLIICTVSSTLLYVDFVVISLFFLPIIMVYLLSVLCPSKVSIRSNEFIRIRFDAWSGLKSFTIYKDIPRISIIESTAVCIRGRFFVDLFALYENNQYFLGMFDSVEAAQDAYSTIQDLVSEGA